MDTIDTLLEQTKSSYAWTHQLLDSIPLEHWETCPQGLNTNVNWQVGHLFMSWYFHTIMCLNGHDPEVAQSIPLRDYGAAFTQSPAQQSIGKFKSEDLLQALSIVEIASLKSIASLSDSDLSNPLAPTKVSNPVAKSKFEAITWNIQHSMWHCGQMAMLKRTFNGAMDFGLQT